MDAPIEAKSLSSLNELADNPPTELSSQLRGSVKGALTLYIARVPGSRDVFLTTMKPRQKVVTAQDVESSLYYCHLETAEDKAIRASFNASDAANVKESPVAADHDLLQPPPLPNRLSQLPSPPITPNATNEFLKIPRKPVSPDPEAHTDEYLVPQPLQPRASPPRSTQSPAMRSGNISPQPAIRRKPVGGHSPNQLPPPFPRRPAGPRPLSKGDDLPIPVHTMGKENLPPCFNTTLPLRREPSETDIPPPLPMRHPRRTGDQSPQATTTTLRPGAPPPLQLRRATDTFSTSPGSAQFGPRSSSASSEDSLISAKDFTVTIIRRDPGSGTQWNIGTFTKDGMARDSSAHKVALEISSGAYDKFNTDESEGDDTDRDGVAARPFRRDLHLRRRRKVAASPRPSPGVMRHPSSHPGSPRGTEFNEASEATPAPFSFTSPWRGSCDFTTGVGGRTMRCRHAVPGRVSGAGHTIDARLALVHSRAVSELRFNLPVVRRDAKHRPSLSAQVSSHSSFDARLGVPGGGGGRPWRHRLTRSIDNFHQRIGITDGPDERDDWDETVLTPGGTFGPPDANRLDLSLGREHAGGGLHGNKAKLGKLIVEGDGMLMLDLVVMANMGLWWSVASK